MGHRQQDLRWWKPWRQRRGRQRGPGLFLLTQGWTPRRRRDQEGFLAQSLLAHRLPLFNFIVLGRTLLEEGRSPQLLPPRHLLAVRLFFDRRQPLGRLTLFRQPFGLWLSLLGHALDQLPLWKCPLLRVFFRRWFAFVGWPLKGQLVEGPHLQGTRFKGRFGPR